MDKNNGDVAFVKHTTYDDYARSWGAKVGGGTGGRGGGLMGRAQQGASMAPACSCEQGTMQQVLTHS